MELTKKQQERVEILKDAIAQIKAEKYKIESSRGYVSLGIDQDDDNTFLEKLADVVEVLEGKKAKDVELKKYINKLVTREKPCTVCAKGAMCISAIRKVNNFSLAEGSLDDKASGYTRKLFGSENADKMERWFEHDYISEFAIGETLRKNAFYKKYPDATDRLIAIFNNAIKNKGIFKPNQFKLD